MADGPGKYDFQATVVMEQTHAAAVALLVIDGDRGSGFSVQSPEHLINLFPELLEDMAAQIRRDNASRRPD